MSSVNKVIIVGNLGVDPEMRYTQAGSPVCNYSVATSENWKDKQTGEKKEKTEWHRCVAFGRVAEISGEYLRKGSKVYIEGSLETSQYEKEGQTHYSTQIKVRDMKMLSPRGESQGGGAPQQQQGGAPQGSRQGAPSRGRAAPPPSQPDLGDDFDDDIPF